LAEDRFALYAQPVVDLANFATIKHELLLRMLLPSGEVVAAHQFLPVAQKYGLMCAIDKWVITKGVEFAAQGKSVAVNLSLQSIVDGDILSHIESELVRTEAPPGNLIFELAETALTKDVNACRKFADRLVSNGCVFALDDFGTGNASLTYLRELPITYVKIDGRFAGGIINEDEDPVIAEAIVLMAQSLGKITIAEGIEDESALEWMRNMGVDLGQGYFIGWPRMDSRLETQ
jgi:EAL domain-containing protein (putative c-di-GMP-specific phosphodiesterase class I)